MLFKDPSGHGEFADLMVTIGVGLNLASFNYNYMAALYAKSQGRDAEAVNHLNWALVDLLFLWLPFSAGGTSVKMGYEVLLVTANSLSRALVNVSALAGYLVTLAEALPGFSQWAASVDAGGISPVERPGMAREDRVDPNGNPVTIFGQTSSSSKTPGHAQAMVDKANEMVASGKYRYILYQRAWRTAVGQDVSRRIPDLVGITRDGIVDAFEVISNTDTPEALKLRLAEGMDSLPDEIQGSYDVIPPSAR